MKNIYSKFILNNQLQNTGKWQDPACKLRILKTEYKFTKLLTKS